MNYRFSAYLVSLLTFVFLSTNAFSANKTIVNGEEIIWEAGTLMGEYDKAVVDEKVDVSLVCEERHPNMQLVRGPIAIQSNLTNQIRVICWFLGGQQIQEFQNAATNVSCPEGYNIIGHGHQIVRAGPSGPTGTQNLTVRTTKVLMSAPVIYSDNLEKAVVNVARTATPGLLGIAVVAKCQPN